MLHFGNIKKKGKSSGRSFKTSDREHCKITFTKYNIKGFSLRGFFLCKISNEWVKQTGDQWSSDCPEMKMSPTHNEFIYSTQIHKKTVLYMAKNSNIALYFVVFVFRMPVLWWSLGLTSSHYSEWENTWWIRPLRLSEDAQLLVSLCHYNPSAPRLPLCATQDSEASPPSSNWKCSFFFLCLLMTLPLCLFLWRMKVLYYGCKMQVGSMSAGCGGDTERPRCRALAAAAGVPVMNWLCLWSWWRWSGLPGQSAAGGMETCLRAHSSDKMAGRKSEG